MNARDIWRFAPLAVFAAVGAVFAVELLDEDSDILESALIDQPVPRFELSNLTAGAEPLSDADLKSGAVSVVNLWASWCGPCKIEHPELMRMAREHGVTIYGIAVRDKPGDSRAMLTQLGDPYAKVGVDPDGQTALRWGYSGVPETFVVDGDGAIVFKQGPISNNDVEKKILPAIEAARRAQAAD